MRKLFNNGKKCVRMWRELVHCARQKHDFSDHEIKASQSLCHRFFFSKWIDLHGEDGVGNYIHMLGSGHFEYYFKNGVTYIVTANRVGRLSTPKSRKFTLTGHREAGTRATTYC